MATEDPGGNRISLMRDATRGTTDIRNSRGLGGLESMIVIALSNMAGLTVLSLLVVTETSLPDRMINSAGPRIETVHPVRQTGLRDQDAGVHLQ